MWQLRQLGIFGKELSIKRGIVAIKIGAAIRQDGTPFQWGGTTILQDGICLCYRILAYGKDILGMDYLSLLHLFHHQG